MSGWGQIGTLGVQKYQADVGAYNAQQQAEGAMWSGVGTMAGMALGGPMGASVGSYFSKKAAPAT
jgi:hypothetical protein